MLKKNRLFYPSSVPALLCVVSICLTPSFGQPKQKPPVPSSLSSRQTADAFLNPASGAITLSKLLDLLQQVREDIETEGRIRRAIEARGIDFPMTPPNEQEIKKAGGSTQLIELLRLKSPPPPPPPSPPPTIVKEDPKGVLNVQCEPGECEIVVEGGPPPLGTHNGTARLALQAGAALVD